MVVQLSGVRGLSMTTVKSVIAFAFVTLAGGSYLFAPPITPVMHAAAISQCNEVTGGSYRASHLEWKLGLRPHWSCWDLRKPGSDPIDLGWWAARV